MSELEIRDAWIRWLPSGLPAAGYLTLINRSDGPMTLVGASSNANRDISLHHSVNHDGMSHMESVAQISVPAKSTLSFAAASYHLMLMQPTRTLTPGEHLTLTLHFAGDCRGPFPSPLTVRAIVVQDGRPVTAERNLELVAPK